jgi:hypothetical protein
MSILSDKLKELQKEFHAEKITFREYFARSKEIVAQYYKKEEGPVVRERRLRNELQEPRVQ